MASLQICPSCGKHVHAPATAQPCPFCGAALDSADLGTQPDTGDSLSLSALQRPAPDVHSPPPVPAYGGPPLRDPTRNPLAFVLTWGLVLALLVTTTLLIAGGIWLAW